MAYLPKEPGGLSAMDTALQNVLSRTTFYPHPSVNNTPEKMLEMVENLFVPKRILDGPVVQTGVM